MKQISNSTLVFLLIAAIAISIGSTVVSIYRINQLIPRITGMGSTGAVNVTITQQSSLTLSDIQIDFGSCAPTATTGCNVSSDSLSADCSCSGGTWPDNITVQNDGNVNINVTVKSGSTASTMIQGNSPQFWYRTENTTARPGCQNQTATPPSYDGNFSIQMNWTSFAVANTEYRVCGNLTFANANDEVALFAKLFLPTDAPIAANRSAVLTFTSYALP